MAVVLAGLLLAATPACASDETPAPDGTPLTAPTTTATASDSSTPAAEATSSASETAAAVLEDGRHPGHVVEVDPAAGTVTVDVVQFLTGDAAASAAAEDGGEVQPPNDYWIRNQNDLLRTLPVAGGARVVTTTLTAAESGDATEPVEVDLQRLAELPGLEGALFWLTVTDGTVVDLEEQYLP